MGSAHATLECLRMAKLQERAVKLSGGVALIRALKSRSSKV
jgi:hypothetical protein